MDALANVNLSNSIKKCGKTVDCHNLAVSSFGDVVSCRVAHNLRCLISSFAV